MKECTAFIFKVAGVFKDSSFLKMKAIYTFEKTGNQEPCYTA
jgi:hypothetical protein